MTRVAIVMAFEMISAFLFGMWYVGTKLQNVRTYRIHLIVSVMLQVLSVAILFPPF